MSRMECRFFSCLSIGIAPILCDMKALPLLRALAFSLLLSGSRNLVQAHTPAEEMAEAADHLLAALTAEQRAKATFTLKEDERQNWHFIPKARNGLTLKEMNPAQRLLAYGLLNSAMSQRGFLKATTIMSLEQVLHEMENQAPHRDAEMYYFSIFGKPGARETWGWRVEGHHLSLNFTIVKGEQISVTPSFYGSNPGEVRSGPRKGLRVMAAEEDLARQLVTSLNAEQKKTALIDTVAPKDVITAAERKVKPLSPIGLTMDKMNKEQSDLLWQVLQEYVRRYRAEIAEKDLEKIQKAGIARIAFAWAGSLEAGQGHYYRIQGPTFLMEYDNTQNNANHIHAVWRDFDSDFGEDLLKKHYEQHPH
jgi:hypothetical protein